MYENFRSLQHAYGPFDTRLTAPSNRRPTSTLPMSHPRSTVKTYSKRRGPYDRSQVPRNSDGPSYENGAPECKTHSRGRNFFLSGSRSHHLQEFRMGSSRDRSLSLVMRRTSIINDLTFWRRNTTAEQRPDVASSSLQLTVLKVEFFSPQSRPLLILLLGWTMGRVLLHREESASTIQSCHGGDRFKTTAHG